MRIPSSVERYRAGELSEVSYDLSDPYDRAIWTAMQLYVDHLERLAIEKGEGENFYQLDEGMQHSLRFHQAWELEEAMNDLRAVVRDGRKMDTGELYETVQSVIEALLAPEGQYLFRIPAEFWERGEQEPPEEPEESPLFLDDTLAPLALLVRGGYELATGGFVSQSEAARRLNMSERGVGYRVERGELRAIRVGVRNVLISTADLEAASA